MKRGKHTIMVGDCVERLRYEKTAENQWLSTAKIRQRVKLLGWDHRIHWLTNPTYRDVRETPRYNWHRWMGQQM